MNRLSAPKKTTYNWSVLLFWIGIISLGAIMYLAANLWLALGVLALVISYILLWAGVTKTGF